MKSPGRDVEINTNSEGYKVHVHEYAHAIVAQAIGWNVTKVEITKTWTGWGGAVAADPPRGRRLDDDTFARQKGTWLLAGVVASVRLDWWQPGGCDGDERLVRELLRFAHTTTYRQVRAIAAVMVRRHWRLICKDAAAAYAKSVAQGRR